MLTSTPIDSVGLRTVPSEVVCLEEKLLGLVCAFLSSRQTLLNEQHLRFLCAPWVHFFTHGIHHYVQSHGTSTALSEQGSLEEALACPMLAAPGDTLAFMEFFRTVKFSEYLDASLAGERPQFTGRTSTNQLRLQQEKKRSTLAFMPCFPRLFRYLLGVWNVGRVKFLENKFDQVDVARDGNARRQLHERVKLSLAKDWPELSSWLALHVADLFPKSLLENLEKNFLDKLNYPENKYLFSADAWHIIDDWKIYAVAQKSKYQTHWIGAPNAISHGSLAIFWQREFELAHMDTYLSWGWAAPVPSRSRLLPFFAPHYAGKKQKKYLPGEGKKGILLSSAARPRHLLEYPYTPDRFERYLKSQLQLAQRLFSLSGLQVAIRTRPKDLGWDVAELVGQLNTPEITLEYQSGAFTDRLSMCQLHICDNCSTTIVESLWANHPSLFIITDDYFQINDSARDDYNILAQVGIFHESMEALLSHFSTIQADIESWWRDVKTQKAIGLFLKRQGQHGAGLRVWSKALTAPQSLASNTLAAR